MEDLSRLYEGNDVTTIYLNVLVDGIDTRRLEVELLKRH